MGGWSGGSGLKPIHLEQFRRFLIPLPALGEQDLMNERLESIDRQLFGEAAEAVKLRALKSGLMDDLLAGRVRVTSLLNAET